MQLTASVGEGHGFHEPIVCSPRNAVRVLYGTGPDVLVMDQFVLGK